MDARHNETEVVVAEVAKDRYFTAQLRELHDLQLAFIGGGSGDAIM